MAAGTAHVDVEMRVNGVPVTGVLVVGVDDHLVLNLGTAASLATIAEARDMLLIRWPELADRVLFVGAEGMAVVRGEKPGGEG